MRKSKIAMGLFALLIAFIIVSCKDDEVTKSRTDLLTQHTWKVKSGTPAEHAIVKSALAAGIEYSFKKDGTVTIIDVRIDKPITGTWEFNSDETKIIADKETDYSTTSKISALDDSNLEFESLDSKQSVTILFGKK